MELGDFLELLMVNCGKGIFDGTGQEIQGIEDAVSFGHYWLRELVEDKSDSVGEEEGFGGAVDDVEAAVVVKCRSNVETVASAEVPQLSNVRLVFNDDGASNRSKRGVIEVERAVEVFPH